MSSKWYVGDYETIEAKYRPHDELHIYVEQIRILNAKLQPCAPVNRNTCVPNHENVRTPIKATLYLDINELVLIS